MPYVHDVDGKVIVLKEAETDVNVVTMTDTKDSLKDND